MEFGNNNILQILERPPNKNNLSIYNIIQIIFMIILGSLSGYKLLDVIFNRKMSFSILLLINYLWNYFYRIYIKLLWIYGR